MLGRCGRPRQKPNQRSRWPPPDQFLLTVRVLRAHGKLPPSIVYPAEDQRGRSSKQGIGSGFARRDRAGSGRRQRAQAGDGNLIGITGLPRQYGPLSLLNHAGVGG